MLTALGTCSYMFNVHVYLFSIYAHVFFNCMMFFAHLNFQASANVYASTCVDADAPLNMDFHVYMRERNLRA